MTRNGSNDRETRSAARQQRARSAEIRRFQLWMYAECRKQLRREQLQREVEAVKLQSLYERMAKRGEALLLGVETA